MSLFVCSECKIIENTALCGYWWEDNKLCSQCDPKIGKWHKRFPREKFNPKKHKVVNGFVIRGLYL